MKITGNEGADLSPQELSDGIQNYANEFNSQQTFTASQVFGKRYIKELLRRDGVKGLRITNVIDADGQTGVALIPVDKKNCPVEPGITIMDGGNSQGPKCPPSCSP